MTTIKLAIQIRDAMNNAGLEYGLRLLNATSSYRFTAIHRLCPDAMYRHSFCDRDSPDARYVPSSIPFEATYCTYPVSLCDVVVIQDAMTDRKLKDHPLCKAVRAYLGVPLITDDGKAMGTLCHFHFEPVSPTDEERALIQDIARYVALRSALLR